MSDNYGRSGRRWRGSLVCYLFGHRWRWVRDITRATDFLHCERCNLYPPEAR